MRLTAGPEMGGGGWVFNTWIKQSGFQQNLFQKIHKQELLPLQRTFPPYFRDYRSVLVEHTVWLEPQQWKYMGNRLKSC
jgi:hypothetical protein